MLNREHALHLAREAASRAAEILRAQRSLPLEISTKSSARDYLTQVDGLVQRAVVGVLHDAFPDHRFIAEEEGAEDIGDPKSPYAWVIDPLDGTMNFIHGKPYVGTLIALQENGETIIGILSRPFFDQVFHGIRGGGAYVNDAPIRLRETKGMMDAILSTNVVHRAREGDDGVWRVSVPPCGSIENHSCATEEMCHILLGYNDGVFYEGPGLWDVAAGCLLIEEAGGRSRTEWLDPKNVRKGVACVATTAPIFEEVEKFLFG